MTALPNALAIAGTDAAGAAGLAADLRTFSAFGVFGAAVVTAVTAQRDDGTGDVFVVPPSLVSQQLDALFARVDVDAVKVGMLGDGETARAVATALSGHPTVPVVLDPALRASSGLWLSAPDTTEAIRHALILRATLVTPNADEASMLLGTTRPRSIEEMHHAARALASSGVSWALVKGGHVELGDSCVDVLSNGRDVFEFHVERRAADRRGTGCTLASAIAALLALGWSVPDACAEAQRYVSSALAQTNDAQAARIGGALVHRPWIPAMEVA
jgi:hydroxymethylpyrimidine/phosphomethylpyrimidine kinase